MSGVETPQVCTTTREEEADHVWDNDVSSLVAPPGLDITSGGIEEPHHKDDLIKSLEPLFEMIKNDQIRPESSIMID